VLIQELGRLSITDLSQLIHSRTLTAAELVEDRLRAIETLGGRINCYITVDAERAVQQASALDRLLASGTDLGVLHGIPLTVKDSLSTAGLRTTAGADIFRDYVPAADADVVRRLKRSGSVIVAKDNMYDMAYGGPNPRYGPTRNPWALDHSCGGSSSGSAAAVAAGLSVASLGTDAGGSIRMPAAFCGVVGVKPTYGLVPRNGEIPHPNTLSAIGPITRTVRDAAIMLHSIAEDEGVAPNSYLRSLEGGVAGLRLAIPRPRPDEPVDDEVAALVEHATDVLAAAGARIATVDLPKLTRFRSVMWVLVGAEFTEGLRHWLRKSPELLNPWTRTQLERGEYIPATEYVHAQRVRAKLQQEMRAALQDAEALVLPTVPAPAFPLPKPEWLEVNGVKEEPLHMSVRYTAPFNCLGLPAVSVPCGFTSAGLPAGLQVVARAFDEATALRVAWSYEAAEPWHLQVPNAVVD
jgi:aspartyl-tRNA(Asn)/glutamyl-tRNA(Gln) amidotransferase subunit A